MARAKNLKDDAVGRRAMQADAEASGTDGVGVDASGSADVRMEKVERLRAAIANGTYSVSAEALAEKMIELMREASPVGSRSDSGKDNS